MSAPMPGLTLVVCKPTKAREKGADIVMESISPTIRHNPIHGFQASLLIKLEKLDWGSILDNKSDGHAP